MPRSIPPRGSIPPNIRGEKQKERKTIDVGNKITRYTGIRIEMGASSRFTGRRSLASSDSYRIQGKPTAKKILGKETLEKLLTWGHQEEQRCINILRTLAPELPEYDKVVERLGKLQDVLEQVKRQLAARR